MESKEIQKPTACFQIVSVVLIMPSYFQFLFSQEERGDASSSEDEARAKDDKASESESDSSEEDSEEEAVLFYMFLRFVDYYNMICRCYLNLRNYSNCAVWCTRMLKCF